MLSTIEGIRQLDSDSFRKIEKRINHRIDLVKEANKAISACKASQGVRETLTQERSDQIKAKLDELENSIDNLGLDGIKDSLQDVEEMLLRCEKREKPTSNFKRK